ncbi:MAG: signal recognition particle-docking protein FtsY [Gammaproteobacteria bacterium]|nr:signal recognition particle-docking protein FtsY [Gammaproteobacteria bacterium]
MTDQNLLDRLKQGLSKTRGVLAEGVQEDSSKTIDEIIIDIEDGLLMADVGIETTDKLMTQLKALIEKQTNSRANIPELLSQCILEILEPSNKPMLLGRIKPFSILVVGVNGAGKTTTIGKLARRLKRNRKSVMLAAGDTFRAAAVEQLITWGERNDIPVVSQSTGADSASVIFDALESACARGIDVLIADTAGRLHTQNDLMTELQKVKRVMTKIDENAPHETLLVLDASMGQNALRQAEEFHQSMNVTGLCITKLDGTAKGGVVIAIADRLGLPIRYIGVGESIDDLQVFDAKEFTSALVGC